MSLQHPHLAQDIEKEKMITLCAEFGAVWGINFPIEELEEITAKFSVLVEHTINKIPFEKWLNIIETLKKDFESLKSSHERRGYFWRYLNQIEESIRAVRPAMENNTTQEVGEESEIVITRNRIMTIFKGILDINFPEQGQADMTLTNNALGHIYEFVTDQLKGYDKDGVTKMWASNSIKLNDSLSRMTPSLRGEFLDAWMADLRDFREKLALANSKS